MFHVHFSTDFDILDSSYSSTTEHLSDADLEVISREA